MLNQDLPGSFAKADSDNPTGSTADSGEFGSIAISNYEDLFGELSSANVTTSVTPVMSHVTPHLHANMNDDGDDGEDSDSNMDDFEAELNTQLEHARGLHPESQSTTPPNPTALIQDATQCGETWRSLRHASECRHV